MRRVLYRLLVPVTRRINALVRGGAAGTHAFQYRLEGVLRPSSQWFDHELDAAYQWPRRGSSLFLERGVLNSLVIRPGARVLELCSGDGFYTQRFYAGRATHVVALDHDTEAVAHARRFHATANVDFRCADVTGDLPGGPFDNVVWDGAMHHFDAAEIERVLRCARDRLRPGGVLSGYTVILFEEYAYARTTFVQPAEVASLLGAHFDAVGILETGSENRRNLYFYASDDPAAIPFDARNPAVLRLERAQAQPEEAGEIRITRTAPAPPLAS